MNKVELDTILEKHRMWLDELQAGERADLSYADLRGADLRGANLRGADLSGADLHGADLHGADLHGADLRGADLRGADLHGADLRCADLCYADLRGANLRYADLRGADLRGANLSGADLDFAVWPLCCGGLHVKADRRLLAQLAYHFCAQSCDDPEYIRARNSIIDFANSFHRAGECGVLELKEERHE